MMRAHRKPLLLALVSLAVAAGARAQAPAKKPLDHSVYDIWNRITNQALSDDGHWALFAYVSEANDPTLNVRDLAGNDLRAIERGAEAQFTKDSRFVVFKLKPAKAAVKQARKDKVRPDRMPKDSLGILDLTTGNIVRVPDVKSFKVPEEAGGWVAYLLEKAPAAEDSTAGPAGGQRGARAGGRGGRGGRAGGPAQADSAGNKKKDEGSTLVVRNLATGAESRIEDVVAYEFSKDGRLLAYTTGNKDGSADGAFALALATGQATTLLKGKGDYKNITVADDGKQVAFLSDQDDYEAKQSAFTLYYWNGKAPAAHAVADAKNAALPEGWWISDNGTLSFSKKGARLFFGTAPRPAPEVEDTVPADERVVVDIWNWKDPLLQPMQLKQVDQERRRTYRAVVQLKDGKVVQLADADMPDINVGDGDAALAVGQSDLPYRQEISWDGRYSDFYLVDLNTGARQKILEHMAGSVSLSPGSRYASWYDNIKRQWFAMDTRSKQVRELTANIPTALYDTLDDHPAPPPAYGAAGWTKGEGLFLVYDAYDVWAVDPTGKNPPRDLTEGVGRRDHLRFRYVNLDRAGAGRFFGFRGGRGSNEGIDPAQDLLLSAFDVDTKDDGFYRDRIQGSNPPAKLLSGPRAYGYPLKAADADVLMLTQSNFAEFPDLYVTNPDFQNLRRISDANPQQSQYLWGTSELVSWVSDDGIPLQGVLYKPDGFDPSRKYPMMVYFYERLSDGLNRYIAPAAGSSSINISYYVSNGYLVFTPDIPYRVGYPGESALKAVVPGVISIINRGFVNPQAIGVQGHSWGGYQIAYLVTRTNIFTAAEAGAPVSNMISAYGGIRWGSGMSRMFQYEKTQSRIGGSLWEAPLHYIENSPIFWADKVQTPLLMMHNDADGAVPWYQGIEYFVALRRLGKPAWMFDYNGEDHGLRKLQNRKDWTIRLQQFFDHYLKGAPAPVWLAEGVPAVMKGKTLGLELEPEQKTAVTNPETSGKNHN